MAGIDQAAIMLNVVIVEGNLVEAGRSLDFLHAETRFLPFDNDLRVTSANALVISVGDVVVARFESAGIRHDENKTTSRVRPPGINPQTDYPFIF